MNNIDTLQQMISESNQICFFGGAGVSTESGIPDFRSVDGLYNQQFDYSPETILSHTFFRSNPTVFFKFLRTKILSGSPQPNAAHLKLAELEKIGKLSTIITQNIDGLHQMAGSKHVIELHGTAQKCYCTRCNKQYGIEAVMNDNPIPKCECGGTIRPKIVLYEEALPTNAMNNATNAVKNADMFIVGGTSLNVYPAAGLINVYVGNKLVLLNRDETGYDNKANLIIRENIGEVLSMIKL